MIFSRLLCVPLFISTVFSVAIRQIPQVNTLIGGVPVRAPSDASAIIPNSYIVVFKGDVDSTAIASHKDRISTIVAKNQRRGVTSSHHGIKKSYKIRKFNAYNVNADSRTLNAISKSSLVEYIEANTYVYTTTIQPGIMYNLDRISHTNITTSGNYQYLYPSSGGSGTSVFVVDTGIMISHPNFGGRAVWGTNTIDTINQDGVGHGTHCKLFPTLCEV